MSKKENQSSDPEIEEEEEELSSTEDEGESDRSFGQQYQYFLDTVIPEGKCPILFFSKIPAKLESEHLQELKKEKEARETNAAKKQLLNQFHKTCNEFDPEKEKQLRKSAKTGTIQLFKSLTQAQTKPQLFDQSQTPKAAKEETKKTEDFLSILKAAALKPKEE